MVALVAEVYYTVTQYNTGIVRGSDGSKVALVAVVAVVAYTVTQVV